MELINHCIKCLVSFEVRYFDDNEIRIEGDTVCCCGDYDENGDLVNGLCGNCCPSKRRLPIWDGKSAGGGFYIRGE